MTASAAYRDQHIAAMRKMLGVKRTHAFAWDSLDRPVRAVVLDSAGLPGDLIGVRWVNLSDSQRMAVRCHVASVAAVLTNALKGLTA